MDILLEENYSDYLQFLKKLVSLPSVFTDQEGCKKAIEYCKMVFDRNLENYQIYFDEAYNLIALPEKFDVSKDIIYLSAHIDTVDAKAEEWDYPFKPWEAFEDDKELVGRGVSDCKAGVAYQLFLSLLAKKGLVTLDNLVFTITFKEEGSGRKTSREIAKRLGSELPLSESDTYLIVLENNVRVQHPPSLCIYTAERGNFVIKLSGSIVELQQNLKRLEKWNPVSISPDSKIDDQSCQVIEQAGGHVCSVPRDKNKLTKVILEANENDVLQAGEERSFAKIPTKIFVSTQDKAQHHSMVLNNRSFDSHEEILKQLHGICYQEVKKFDISGGLNIEEKFKGNKIYKIISECENPSLLKLEHTFNVGASDATIIYNSMNPDLQKNFYPIVMGPGSRSQREMNRPRLTHGKNETYDKKSGLLSMQFISRVLEEVGVVR